MKKKDATNACLLVLLDCKCIEKKISDNFFLKVFVFVFFAYLCMRQVHTNH